MRMRLVRAALVVGAAVLVGVGVFATPAMAAVNSRQCANFGSANGSGYRAAQCTQYEFTSDSRFFTVGAQGLPWCKNPSGSETPCVGVSSTVTLSDITSGDTFSKLYICGSYGGSSCPTGIEIEPHYMTTNILAACHLIQTKINTSIRLPGGGTVSSGDYSAAPQLLPPGCANGG